MRMLFVGPLWAGSTALQRLRAFEAIEGAAVHALDSLERVGKASIIDRVRHKLRLPADRHNLNGRLLNAVGEVRPDVLFIDSSRVISPRTLKKIKKEHKPILIFYSPDDVSAPHNSSRQLEACDRLWDVFFTTKSFNVPELKARGVRNPALIGNAYDPSLHRPWTDVETGDEYEKFDAVFVGTYEEERTRSLNKLKEAGINIVVYGNNWGRARLHPSIELRGAAFADDYMRALHTGKLALCYLRKINRDLVTTRSVELPAAARPMIAEKTEEHDQLFLDGREYLSFANDDELIERVKKLLSDDEARMKIAAAGRERCIRSGYSSIDRAKEMLKHILV